MHSLIYDTSGSLLIRVTESHKRQPFKTHSLQSNKRSQNKARTVRLYLIVACVFLLLSSRASAQGTASIGVELGESIGPGNSWAQIGSAAARATNLPKKFTTVTQLLHAGPAERAGVKTNDLILFIAEGNDESERFLVKDQNWVAANLRGEKGSTVRICVARDPPFYRDRKWITIIRDDIPELIEDVEKRKAEGLKLEHVVNQAEKIVGYFSENNALYVLAVDAKTGIVDQRVHAADNIIFTSEQGEINEWQLRQALEDSEGVQLLCDDLFMRQFLSIIPKYHEWAIKARELKPPSFKKLLPNSEISTEQKSYSVYFVWAPESDNSAPTSQLIFYETMFSNASQLLALKESEVKLSEAVIRAYPQAEQMLRKVFEQSRSKGQSQRKKVEDNFN